jgi:hypothetical protein
VPRIPISCFDRHQYPDEDALKPCLHLMRPKACDLISPRNAANMVLKLPDCGIKRVDFEPEYRALATRPRKRPRVSRPGGLDWNCPQHITPRFTLAEFEAANAPAAIAPTTGESVA